MNIEHYTHHDKIVAVQTELKGKHREHCLCYGCDKFKPLREDHCPIADAVFANCVKFNVVTPVWECPDFSAQE